LLLERVPEQHRDTVGGALDAAFDAGNVTGVHAVTGGASGALTYRLETRDGDHLLRVETMTGPMRNPHQYACMQLAADAGGLLAQVHELAPFASRGDYLVNLDRMLAYLGRSGRVTSGVLGRHADAYARLREVYPWDPTSFVSAHNDPNPFNLLFDGDRLWLVDWETAYPNDPLIDVATISSHLAPTDDLRDVLLRAWLGDEPDAVVRAKTSLAGWLVQLYSGCILLTVVVDPTNPTHADLTAMTPAEFGAAIERGALVPGQPATTHAYAKIMLQAFLDAVDSPAFTAAAEVLR
jgi:hypothetical protein